MVETWIECDITKPVRVQKLDGSLYSQDEQANKIGAIVTNDGEPVTLTGTVKGYVIKPDSSTIEITGDKSENRAWIVLPDTAYTRTGKMSIVVKNINDSDTVTLCAIEAYCIESR